MNVFILYFLCSQVDDIRRFAHRIRLPLHQQLHHHLRDHPGYLRADAFGPTALRAPAEPHPQQDHQRQRSLHRSRSILRRVQPHQRGGRTLSTAQATGNRRNDGHNVRQHSDHNRVVVDTRQIDRQHDAKEQGLKTLYKIIVFKRHFERTNMNTTHNHIKSFKSERNRM